MVLIKSFWYNEMWTTSSWPVYTYTDYIVELLKAGADPTGPYSSQQDNLSSILAYDVDTNGTNKEAAMLVLVSGRKEEQQSQREEKTSIRYDNKRNHPRAIVKVAPAFCNHQDFTDGG